MTYIHDTTSQPALATLAITLLAYRPIWSALPGLTPDLGDALLGELLGYLPGWGAEGLPDALKPWGHILVAAMTDGDAGIRRAVRARATEELEALEQEIPSQAEVVPGIIAALGLEAATGPGFWPGVALPAIRAELARRRRPAPAGASGGRIAALKAANRLEDVAGRYTTLRPSGAGKLRGLCPLHREKTPSFVVYVEQQRWHCFGACATGGDILDLAERLGVTL